MVCKGLISWTEYINFWLNADVTTMSGLQVLPDLLKNIQKGENFVKS